MFRRGNTRFSGNDRGRFQTEVVHGRRLQGDVRFWFRYLLLVGGWPYFAARVGLAVRTSRFTIINPHCWLRGQTSLVRSNFCGKEGKAGGSGQNAEKAQGLRMKVATTRAEAIAPEWLVPYDDTAAAIVGERGRLQRRWRPRPYVFMEGEEHHKAECTELPRKKARGQPDWRTPALTESCSPSTRWERSYLAPPDGATRRHHQARHGAAQRT